MNCLKQVVPLLLFLLCAIPAHAKDGVVVLKISGAINPIVSDYVNQEIRSANESREALVVIEMDTPGGLDTSMRAIIKEIQNSNVPVAAYVSPSGSRAASAGTFIAIASHIAAMSPGTNIGAAHPVNMMGASKRIMEMFLMQASLSLPIATARFSSTTGEGAISASAR